MIVGILLHVTVECRCRKTVIADSGKPVGENGVVRDRGKKGQSICVWSLSISATWCYMCERLLYFLPPEIPLEKHFHLRRDVSLLKINVCLIRVRYSFMDFVWSIQRFWRIPIYYADVQEVL